MRKLPKLLSKTKIMRGYRCLKSIYLTLHRPELEPKVTEAQQQVFDQGNEVGEKAREYYPGGTLVDCKPWEFVDALKKTRELLKLGTEHIYEGAFEYKGCYARADILKYNPVTQRWTLLEVKSATKVKPEHLDDIGLQAWIIANSGIKLEKICLVHLNSECRYPDLSNLFVEVEVTDRLREDYREISPRLNQIFSVIRRPEPPDIDIGSQCEAHGRECEFKSACWKEKQIPEMSVFDLPRIGDQAWEFYRQNKIELSSVDETQLDLLQRRVISCHVESKRFVDTPALRDNMKNWNTPLLFLDFETINPAIPCFSGCSPYEQVPFQFSVHKMDSLSGKLEHREHLHDDRSDPRPGLIPALLDACKGDAKIVAYYAKFERGCLEALAEFSPEHRDKLLGLAERLVDPLPLIREFVYDPQFNGRFSLKFVAPALLGDAYSYKDMVVNDGSAAQRTFKRLITEHDFIQKESLRKAMLEYCQKDTLALAETVKWLLNV